MIQFCFCFQIFQIDFGGDDGAGGIAFGNDIDFGASDEANTDVTLETGDIDWGIDETNADEINFDISLKDSGITVESSGMEGGVARNSEALTVLDSPIYREQFLDELFEVNLFSRCLTKNRLV